MRGIMDLIAAAHHRACVWLATQPLDVDVGQPHEQQAVPAPIHQPHVYRRSQQPAETEDQNAHPVASQGGHSAAAQWGVIQQGVLADVRGLHMSTNSCLDGQTIKSFSF
jgi:hypothetical protein